MRTARKKPDLDNLKLVSDLGRMAVGALGSFGGMKDMIKERVDQMIERMDLVSRAEFERVEAMAQRARERQEELEERLAALEKKSGAKKTVAAKRKKK